MKRLLLLSMLLFGVHLLFATHNRAGEIIYEQIDQLTIRASIITYTKESSRPADRDTLTICWGDGECERVLRSNGNGEGVPLGNDYQWNVYTAVHVYAVVGEYILSMTDPNRNGGILNVNPPNSSTVPFHIQTTITVLDLSSGGSNQSPILLLPPIDLAFVGLPFVHNPSAFDPDGDSIAYELITPMADLNTPVPNYSFPNEVEPDANNTFSLNEVTGTLTWDAPQLLGEYNVAILIKSYRQGVLIDASIRDMQILVVPDANPTPKITTSLEEEMLHEVLIGDTVRIDITATDEDAQQEVTLSSSSGLFDYFERPAEFKVEANGNSASGQFEWIVGEEHLREEPYVVIFKAQDDFLNMPNTDLAVIRFKVFDAISSTDDLAIEVRPIRIFPNPSDRQLIKIEHSNWDKTVPYLIFDANGRKVKDGLLNGAIAEIELPNLSVGTYFLMVKGADSWSRGRFVLIE